MFCVADEMTGASLDLDVEDDYQSSLALQRKLKQKKQLQPEKVGNPGMRHN